MTSTHALYDAYEQRYWRELVRRTRSRGIEFVLGRREGPYVWERDSGFRLLDCGLTGGVHGLGHRHPDILAALTGALEAGLDSGLWNFPTHEMLAFQDLMAALAPVPALNRTVVTLGATASIDLAVQFCARVTGRHKVLAYRHGYHGHAGFAAMVTGSESEGIAGHYGLPNSTARFFPNYGVLDDVAAAMGPDIAAIIIEPFNYETFAPPPADYLPGVEALCRRHGALLIIDETRTGLSRSGRLWMSEHDAFTPDILISGKGLGGGLYPVSALLTTEAIYDDCINGHAYGFASSMAGNEIACTVGRRVLEVASRPETLAHVARLEARFREAFAALCERHPGVYAPAHIRGGVVTLGLRDPADADAIGPALFRHGVYCHSVSLVDPLVVKFFPVLTAPLDIVDEVAEALDRFARRGH
ncbi:aminotransferase class III-fold pyridoxal phosphate-dependent enzyme [Bosea sp. 117]|uniref:aminotransferase class III-fold pyridoxal phosphate-dependent enzyme n=1 Tax=Bosea sp. 117 TaxID=1125973 RepID=UPI000A97ACA2|nr:aminotransferase class III-fold pyridoxal phosphate-dependent enzyme [Bosea sp. 117]